MRTVYFKLEMIIIFKQIETAIFQSQSTCFDYQMSFKHIVEMYLNI